MNQGYIFFIYPLINKPNVGKYSTLSKLARKKSKKIVKGFVNDGASTAKICKLEQKAFSKF